MLLPVKLPVPLLLLKRNLSLLNPRLSLNRLHLSHRPLHTGSISTLFHLAITITSRLPALPTAARPRTAHLKTGLRITVLLPKLTKIKATVLRVEHLLKVVRARDSLLKVPPRIRHLGTRPHRRSRRLANSLLT